MAHFSSDPSPGSLPSASTHPELVPMANRVLDFLSDELSEVMDAVTAELQALEIDASCTVIEDVSSSTTTGRPLPTTHPTFNTEASAFPLSAVEALGPYSPLPDLARSLTTRSMPLLHRSSSVEELTHAFESMLLAADIANDPSSAIATSGVTSADGDHVNSMTAQSSTSSASLPASSSSPASKHSQANSLGSSGLSPQSDELSEKEAMKWSLETMRIALDSIALLEQQAVLESLRQHQSQLRPATQQASPRTPASPRLHQQEQHEELHEKKSSPASTSTSPSPPPSPAPSATPVPTRPPRVAKIRINPAVAGRFILAALSDYRQMGAAAAAAAAAAADTAPTNASSETPPASAPTSSPHLATTTDAMNTNDSMESRVTDADMYSSQSSLSPHQNRTSSSLSPASTPSSTTHSPGIAHASMASSTSSNGSVAHTSVSTPSSTSPGPSSSNAPSLASSRASSVASGTVAASSPHTPHSQASAMNSTAVSPGSTSPASQGPTLEQAEAYQRNRVVEARERDREMRRMLREFVKREAHRQRQEELASRAEHLRVEEERFSAAGTAEQNTMDVAAMDGIGGGGAGGGGLGRGLGVGPATDVGSVAEPVGEIDPPVQTMYASNGLLNGAHLNEAHLNGMHSGSTDEAHGGDVAVGGDVVVMDINPSDAHELGGDDYSAATGTMSTSTSTSTGGSYPISTAQQGHISYNTVDGGDNGPHQPHDHVPHDHHSHFVHDHSHGYGHGLGHPYGSTASASVEAQYAALAHAYGLTALSRYHLAATSYSRLGQGNGLGRGGRSTSGAPASVILSSSSRRHAASGAATVLSINEMRARVRAMGQDLIHRSQRLLDERVRLGLEPPGRARHTKTSLSSSASTSFAATSSSSADCIEGDAAPPSFLEASSMASLHATVLTTAHSAIQSASAESSLSSSSSSSASPSTLPLAVPSSPSPSARSTTAVFAPSLQRSPTLASIFGRRVAIPRNARSRQPSPLHSLRGSPNHSLLNTPAFGSPARIQGRATMPTTFASASSPATTTMMTSFDMLAGDSSSSSSSLSSSSSSPITTSTAASSSASASMLSFSADMSHRPLPLHVTPVAVAAAQQVLIAASSTDTTTPPPFQSTFVASSTSSSSSSSSPVSSSSLERSTVDVDINVNVDVDKLPAVPTPASAQDFYSPDPMQVSGAFQGLWRGDGPVEHGPRGPGIGDDVAGGPPRRVSVQKPLRPVSDLTLQWVPSIHTLDTVAQAQLQYYEQVRELQQMQRRSAAAAAVAATTASDDDDHHHHHHHHSHPPSARSDALLGPAITVGTGIASRSSTDEVDCPPSLYGRFGHAATATPHGVLVIGGCTFPRYAYRPGCPGKQSKRHGAARTHAHAHTHGHDMGGVGEDEAGSRKERCAICRCLAERATARARRRARRKAAALVPKPSDAASSTASVPPAASFDDNGSMSERDSTDISNASDSGSGTDHSNGDLPSDLSDFNEDDEEAGFEHLCEDDGEDDEHASGPDAYHRRDHGRANKCASETRAETEMEVESGLVVRANEELLCPLFMAERGAALAENDGRKRGESSNERHRHDHSMKTCENDGEDDFLAVDPLTLPQKPRSARGRVVQLRMLPVTLDILSPYNVWTRPQPERGGTPDPDIQYTRQMQEMQRQQQQEQQRQRQREEEEQQQQQHYQQMQRDRFQPLHHQRDNSPSNITETGTLNMSFSDVHDISHHPTPPSASSNPASSSPSSSMSVGPVSAHAAAAAAAAAETEGALRTDMDLIASPASPDYNTADYPPPMSPSYDPAIGGVPGQIPSSAGDLDPSSSTAHVPPMQAGHAHAHSVRAPPPAGVACHTLNYVPGTDTCLLFGGLYPSRRPFRAESVPWVEDQMHGEAQPPTQGSGMMPSSYLYALSLTTWRWSRPDLVHDQAYSARPLPRYGHSAAVFAGRLVVFGGAMVAFGLVPSARTPTLGESSSSHVSGGAASAGGTGGHVASGHTLRKELNSSCVITTSIVPINDIMVFDLQTNMWFPFLPTGQPPSPRLFHASALASDSFIVFGGLGPAPANPSTFIPLNDLYVCHLRAKTWTQIDVGPSPGRPLPLPRYGHTMHFVSGGETGNVLLVLGGFGCEVSSIFHNGIDETLARTLAPGSSDFRTMVSQWLKLAPKPAVLHDVWALELDPPSSYSPASASTSTSASGSVPSPSFASPSLSSPHEPHWAVVRLQGAASSPRAFHCSLAMRIDEFDTRLLVLGGISSTSQHRQTAARRGTASSGARHGRAAVMKTHNATAINEMKGDWEGEEGGVVYRSRSKRKRGEDGDGGDDDDDDDDDDRDEGRDLRDDDDASFDSMKDNLTDKHAATSDRIVLTTTPSVSALNTSSSSSSQAPRYPSGFVQSSVKRRSPSPPAAPREPPATPTSSSTTSSSSSSSATANATSTAGPFVPLCGSPSPLNARPINESYVSTTDSSSKEREWEGGVRGARGGRLGGESRSDFYVCLLPYAVHLESAAAPTHDAVSRAQRSRSQAIESLRLRNHNHQAEALSAGAAFGLPSGELILHPPSVLSLRLQRRAHTSSTS